jgi:hypothetical protein
LAARAGDEEVPYREVALMTVRRLCGRGLVVALAAAALACGGCDGGRADPPAAGPAAAPGPAPPAGGGEALAGTWVRGPVKGPDGYGH